METQISDNEFLCTNVQQGNMVWVRSDQFDCECWGYAVSLGYSPPLDNPEYKGLPKTEGHAYLNINLELDEDHPSMQEAMRDSGFAYDQVEIHDLIPVDQVEYIRYLSAIPDRPVRVWKRSITSHERAERSRRRGEPRLSLPELDKGLRR